MLNPFASPTPPPTSSDKSRESPADSPQEKIKRGIKLTDAEKVEHKKWLAEQDAQPVTLDELEIANDKILKRIIRGVNNVESKDLPKMLDIVRTAINEKRSKGEKTKTEEVIKPPTRAEMLAKIAGRRADKVE